MLPLPQANPKTTTVPTSSYRRMSRWRKLPNSSSTSITTKVRSADFSSRNGTMPKASTRNRRIPNHQHHHRRQQTSKISPTFSNLCSKTYMRDSKASNSSSSNLQNNSHRQRQGLQQRQQRSSSNSKSINKTGHLS